MFGRQAKEPAPLSERANITPGTWTCTVELGEDWFSLDLDAEPEAFEAHVRKAVVADAPHVVEREVPPERAEAIAEEFGHFLRRVQASNAFGASLYRPVFDGPTVALLESHVFEGRMKRGWEDQVRAEYADQPRTEVTETKRLKLGKLVRVHEMTGPSEGHEESTVVEMVSHFFLSPVGELIRFTMSWTVPDDGTLSALADDVMDGVRIG